jgi:hypothetical protein
MKVLPILLSLALSLTSCRKQQWYVETFTYDNLVREEIPITQPIRIYYLKSDINFRYKIIGRAHATCTEIQTLEHPIPEKLLAKQARKIGGFALLSPTLDDDYTWTAAIIEIVD